MTPLKNSAPCSLCGATINKCNLHVDSDQCENLKLSKYKESAGHVPKTSPVEEASKPFNPHPYTTE